MTTASSDPRQLFPRRAVTLLFLGAAGVALVGAGASIARAAATAAPTGGPATYWMIAETGSGMGSMMGAGGGRGMNMQAMMMGGGAQSSYSHNLQLQLGTGRRPAGEPSAEHLPPAGLRVGPSLPLVTPRGTPADPTPWKMEKPKGRMLIYWGCGDHVRPNQPAVIDYASIAAGKMPPAFASFRTLSGPSAGRNATYGEWPNARSDQRVPAAGSLLGEHVVRGNYTPEIRFTLAQGQDFLAPVDVSGNEAGPGGAVPLSWRPVAGAKAWLVSTMGSARNGDVILWSSSESQAMAMAVAQIAPDEIARLVQSKVLLSASATRCTVPAEVARAAESSVLMTTALGGEANFSHPARPAKAPAGWRPDWTVKLLTKSTYTGILGMDMAAMMGGGMAGSGAGQDEDEPRPQPKRKKSPFGGLGDLLGQ
jgi:hypothetical protein